MLSELYVMKFVGKKNKTLVYYQHILTKRTYAKSS